LLRGPEILELYQMVYRMNEAVIMRLLLLPKVGWWLVIRFEVDWKGSFELDVNEIERFFPIKLLLGLLLLEGSLWLSVSDFFFGLTFENKIPEFIT
jgi:hypothetical protein